MNKRNAGTLLIGVVLAGSAFAGGLYLRQQLEPAAEPAGEAITLAQLAILPADALVSRAADPERPDRRPDFRFVDQDARERRMADWDGQVLVVNFWATWCPPCIDEIPAFIEAQTAYAGDGVQFVGIALDDVESVREFASDFGLNYPTAAGDQSAVDVMRQYGNVAGGLPYTAIISRDGDITHRHTGPITRKQLDRLLAPMLTGAKPA